MRLSVLLNSVDNFFVNSNLIFLRNLSDIILLKSENICVLCQVAPRMFFHNSESYDLHVFGYVSELPLFHGKEINND